MKLAEILTGPETWCKWWTGRGGHARCVWSALGQLHPDMVQTETGSNGKRVSIYNGQHPEVLRFRRIVGAYSIAEWNDAPERTWDEVALAIDAYDRDRMLNP